MLNAIRHGLSNLFRFSGRDSRRQFWFYALFVYVFMHVGMTAAMIPLLGTADSGLHRHFGAIIQGVGMVTLCGVLLLAAAVVRRLHDSGRSGSWGLLPLPFLVFGLVRMVGFSEQALRGRDEGAFMLIFFNNLIYLACLGFLIFLLARPATPGDNRYGPPARQA